MTGVWPGWTRHGHRIAGVPTVLDRPPVPVARCGGPAMCSQCAKDAEAQRSDADRPAVTLEVSCRCGATLSVSGGEQQVKNTHAMWLDAHAFCREPR